MELLRHLLDADPAAPRLTVYNETTGARLDFSAQTLDNWAAKVGNMLLEELDLEADSVILIDLPVGWQSAVIVLGALAAGVDTHFGEGEADAVFTSPERAEVHAAATDLVLVTEDPFGRGVVETGGELPRGAIDFGPTVRFYGDQFFQPTPALPELVTDTDIAAGARALGTGWTDYPGFRRQVLEPLSVTGSTVIVSGMADAERLTQIETAEKVNLRL